LTACLTTNLSVPVVAVGVENCRFLCGRWCNCFRSFIAGVAGDVTGIAVANLGHHHSVAVGVVHGGDV
jgi:hypothetical protein